MVFHQSKGDQPVAKGWPSGATQIGKANGDRFDMESKQYAVGFGAWAENRRPRQVSRISRPISKCFACFVFVVSFFRSLLFSAALKEHHHFGGSPKKTQHLKNSQPEAPEFQ